MSTAAVFVPHRALETAIALAKRLQDVCQAEIHDIEAVGDETVVRLSIPSRAFEALHGRRRGLWNSFVTERVETRRALAASTQRRIVERRAWVQGSREIARVNRQEMLAFSLSLKLPRDRRVAIGS
jgi:hypothetical protein